MHILHVADEVIGTTGPTMVCDPLLSFTYMLVKITFLIQVLQIFGLGLLSLCHFKSELFLVCLLNSKLFGFLLLLLACCLNLNCSYSLKTAVIEGLGGKKSATDWK